MKKYFIFALILLISSRLYAQENRSQKSNSPINKYLSEKEIEYLKVRDNNIEHFKKLQSQKQVNIDSLIKLEDIVLLDLETRLREILKDSHFASQGKINLETLLNFIGFGMLEGLTLDRDSIRIFYTTKNLFFNYFNNISQLNKLSPKELESIFRSAFASDFALADLADIKITTTKNHLVYGMAGMGYQMGGPGLPDFLFVLFSKDNYIYMAERQLKKSLKELPKCRSIWDNAIKESEKNLETYRQSGLNDTTSFNKVLKLEDIAFDKYCECFRQEFIKDSQFAVILNQLNEMIYSLEANNR